MLLDNIDEKDIYKSHIISLIMKNAKMLGWNIEKENSNVYVLKKKIKNLSKNETTTESLIDTILDINNFY
jgi:hypothetical protein